ncbi:Thiamin-phosphate pyrophosphorylase [Roseibacterium elongatum DSM 19469]|uniref:Thiamine-phosphate synthase n=1 Tax=Roseicyclus elongatus DSM 19469 TaxID=1294273 RepID=W8RWP2_9RHOB|nr:thiamine phosphate synthase [Roseibacterium elongatum]AHM05768.1 Thiamin-phosphate pyrophosphorylase [Roseibacterium elongatum DSM 19469]
MIGPIYVVTDPDAPLPQRDQAMAAARGGAWAVQIRDKTAPDVEVARLVEALIEMLTPMGVRVFVNDRVEVARATGADLHIGQGDGDPLRARDRIAPDALLGLSIETVAQCARIPKGVAYIGAGPFRATATKPDAAAPIGAEGLARIVAAAPVPSIAIGGLTSRDINTLKQAGAAGMAVVSAVTRAPNPEAATRALVNAWRQP